MSRGRALMGARPSAVRGTDVTELSWFTDREPNMSSETCGIRESSPGVISLAPQTWQIAQTLGWKYLNSRSVHR